jgi:hypothetical protein
MRNAKKEPRQAGEQRLLNAPLKQTNKHDVQLDAQQSAVRYRRHLLEKWGTLVLVTTLGVGATVLAYHFTGLGGSIPVSVAHITLHIRLSL